MYDWIKLFWIAAGGAAGSVLRYLLAGWVQKDVWPLPVGTLAVNVLGCLAIGFLATRFDMIAVSSHVRMGVLVGLLGGFTTFSTFSWETLRLLRDGQLAYAGINVLGTVMICLLSAWAGHALAIRLGRS